MLCLLPIETPEPGSPVVLSREVRAGITRRLDAVRVARLATRLFAFAAALGTLLAFVALTRNTLATLVASAFAALFYVLTLASHRATLRALDDLQEEALWMARCCGEGAVGPLVETLRCLGYAASEATTREAWAALVRWLTTPDSRAVSRLTPGEQAAFQKLLRECIEDYRRPGQSGDAFRRPPCDDTLTSALLLACACAGEVRHAAFVARLLSSTSLPSSVEAAALRYLGAAQRVRTLSMRR